MCTMILFFRVYPHVPIVLGANRDEFVDRVSLAPHAWEARTGSGPVRVFAGRDEAVGGTWFGVSRHGMVAGLTNRYTGSRDLSKASRGQIVLDCLAQPSPDAARRMLEAADLTRFNPFNL